MQESEGHKIWVEGRKKFSATEIEAVEAFSPTRLVLSFAGGKIVVSGTEMKITSFLKSNGSFSASGNIISVAYASRGAGIKQKLLK